MKKLNWHARRAVQDAIGYATGARNAVFVANSSGWDTETKCKFMALARHRAEWARLCADRARAAGWRP